MIQSKSEIWICDNCHITTAPVNPNISKHPVGWQIISSSDQNGFSSQYAICDNQVTCNKNSLTVSKFPAKPQEDP
jgi:hypothetical protein